MKRIVAVAAVFFLLCGALDAQVPHYIHFQGYLTDSADNPLSGTYVMVFRIYDVDSGGAHLWEEPHNSVSVTDGYYDVVLGSTTALNLAFDAQYYLALEVNADGEMSPRYRMCAAPYAIRAETAEDSDNLAGENPSYYLDYNNLTGKPASMPPDAHTHAGGDITSAVSEADMVDGFHASSTPTAGQLLALDGTGKFPSSAVPPVTDASTLGGQLPSYYLDWPNFTSVPGTFPPSAHTHPWAEVTGKPAAYPPESHTHAGGDITSAVSQADNADTVDSFHASATPIPNYLLPLDGTGKFPSAVLPAIGDDSSKALAAQVMAKVALLEGTTMSDLHSGSNYCDVFLHQRGLRDSVREESDFVLKEDFEDTPLDYQMIEHTALGTRGRDITRGANGTSVSYYVKGGGDNEREGAYSDVIFSSYPSVVQFYIQNTVTGDDYGRFGISSRTTALSNGIYWTIAATGSPGEVTSHRGTMDLTFFGTGSWYKITVAFDWAAMTYSMWVDDVLKQGDVDFSLESGEMNPAGLRVWIYAGDFSNQVWIDEISEKLFDATGVPDAVAGEWDLADGEHVTLTLTSVSAIDSLYLWVESGTDGKADLLCDIDTNDDGIYDEIDKQLAAWTLLTSQIAASSPFRVRMKAVGGNASIRAYSLVSK